MESRQIHPRFSPGLCRFTGHGEPPSSRPPPFAPTRSKKISSYAAEANVALEALDAV